MARSSLISTQFFRRVIMSARERMLELGYIGHHCNPVASAVPESADRYIASSVATAFSPISASTPGKYGSPRHASMKAHSDYGPTPSTSVFSNSKPG